jgi:hypothetical protein
MHQELDPEKNLANCLSPTPNHLRAMKSLARMREQADRSDMGFAGSFVTEEGYHYSVTNLPEDDIQRQTVDYLVKLKLNGDFNPVQIPKYFRIVSTDEGVQIQVINEDDDLIC